MAEISANQDEAQNKFNAHTNKNSAYLGILENYITLFPQDSSLVCLQGKLESVIVELLKVVPDLDFSPFLNDLCRRYKLSYPIRRSLDDWVEGLRQKHKQKPIKLITVSRLLEDVPCEPNQVITDMFDVGDKVAIIGSSKMRKSFFALQLAFNLALGRDFLEWVIPTPRTVLFVQLELTLAHMHRRVHAMGQRLNVSSERIAGQFIVLNGRGLYLTLTDILEAVRLQEPEVVIIDPLYKLITGDENLAYDMRPVMQQLDSLAEQACVIYIHHDPKGATYNRDIRDRGAGSGLVGRDYDACVTISPHAQDESLIVVDSLLRNYPSINPFSACWANGLFSKSSVPPIAKENTRKKKATIDMGMTSYKEFALTLLADGPLELPLFLTKLRAKFGFGITAARSVYSDLLLDKSVEAIGGNKRHGGKTTVGLPSDLGEQRAFQNALQYQDKDDAEII